MCDLLAVCVVLVVLLGVLYLLIRQINSECSCAMSADDTKKKLEDLKNSLNSFNLQRPYKNSFIEKAPENRKRGRPSSKPSKGNSYDF